MVYLTRSYRFAAAHRLHSGSLSEEENHSVYGKCNNPYGHGHNYVLEVTVAGPVDPATGMVMELGFLDGTVEREVLERFDQKHLNLDVENFPQPCTDHREPLHRDLQAALRGTRSFQRRPHDAAAGPFGGNKLQFF